MAWISYASPGPVIAAERLISILPDLRARTNGSFVDSCEILDPERYAALRDR